MRGLMQDWCGIAGIGAVGHTLNPRLFLEPIGYIVNHAADRQLLADLEYAPPFEVAR